MHTCHSRSFSPSGLQWAPVYVLCPPFLHSLLPSGTIVSSELHFAAPVSTSLSLSWDYRELWAISCGPWHFTLTFSPVCTTFITSDVSMWWVGCSSVIACCLGSPLLTYSSISFNFQGKFQGGPLMAPSWSLFSLIIFLSLILLWFYCEKLVLIEVYTIIFRDKIKWSMWVALK